MTARGVLRALVSGLLALVVMASALVARPAAQSGPVGEHAAEAPWRMVGVAPGVQRLAASLPDHADDASAPAGDVAPPRPDPPTQAAAAAPAIRPQLRPSCPPARGPPGFAL